MIKDGFVVIDAMKIDLTIDITYRLDFSIR